MAFTVTKVANVVGNLRQNILTVLADGAEANLDTGLSRVVGFSTGLKSMATMGFTMVENKNSSGTASNGKIGISGIASGDEFILTVYGV